MSWSAGVRAAAATDSLAASVRLGAAAAAEFKLEKPASEPGAERLPVPAGPVHLIISARHAVGQCHWHRRSLTRDGHRASDGLVGSLA
jgi:hypothetical protein